MSFKDQLDKAMQDIDQKICNKIFQIERLDEKNAEIEEDLTELYEELEDLEREKIKIQTAINEQK